MFTSRDSLFGQLVYDPQAEAGYQLFWVFPQNEDIHLLNKLPPAINRVFEEFNYSELRSTVDYSNIKEGGFFLYPEHLPTEVTAEQVDEWFETIVDHLKSEAAVPA